MKLILHNTERLFLVLTVLLGTILACDIDGKEYPTYKLDKEYLIDSGNILELLAQGEKEVFLEWKESSNEEPSSQNEIVNWGQADYLQIAGALHQFVWNEPLSTLDLYRMSFSLDCSETKSGFQDGLFKFFRVIETEDGEARIEHGIYIEPGNNYASAWEIKYEPNLSNWEPVDLVKINVPAEQALQIAEKDGGQKKRLAASNACKISVGITRDRVGFEDGWLVIYSPNVFVDTIDPVTGK